MKITTFETEKHYETLSGWWERHAVPAVPLAILPTFGAFVGVGDTNIAVGFVYFSKDNKLGVVDWITTNPDMATGPTTREAVARLLGYFEHLAKSEGCHNLMSFVAKDTGLYRFMVRAGWQDPKSTANVYLCKSW